MSAALIKASLSIDSVHAATPIERVTRKIIFESFKKLIIEEIKKRHAIGQPILIGTASIEHNELLSAMLGQANIPHEVLNAKNHEREGAIIAQAGKIGAITVATNMAGRGIDIILGGNPPNAEKQKKVKELGGLYVIGTERHEARRIDNQLRGRSGRQGDSGESRFFLSLEDDLLRIFGGERIKKMMDSFNLPEDQPIESRLISKVVNEAQKKIEGLNFDSRKHLLEYDDILNKQRNSIYEKRQKFLEENAHPQILMCLDTLWMNHLEHMEYLRESVKLRAYGQHDPLVEYRKESHILFKQLLENFEKWVEENKEKLIASQNPLADNETKKLEEQHSRAQVLNNNHNSYPNVGRNDLCPCNSGKKYKRCHGQWG